MSVLTWSAHSSFALAATLGCALAAPAPALAQSGEFRMDQSGNWVQVGTPEAGTDAALFAQARKALAEDRPADAEAMVSPWIDAHDRSGDKLLADALVIRGDALTAQGDEYNALYDYERAIKEFPASKAFTTGVERELDVGVRYTGGLKRKFFGVRMLPAEDIGEELLIRVQERMPASRLAERAGIELADYYYREHELDLAVEMYDLFVQLYPNSQYKQRAMQRRIYATIARFKGPKYDGSSLIDAKILTRRYASLYPAEAEKAGLDDGLMTRLDESAGTQMLETATWYLHRNDDVAARHTLRRLVRDHPQTAAAQQALRILKDHNWSIQIATGKAKPQSGTDFESGVTGSKVEGDGKPAEPGDKSEPATPAPPGAKPASPDDRPPPVELHRRKPQIPPGTTPPAAEPGASEPQPSAPPQEPKQP